MSIAPDVEVEVDATFAANALRPFLVVLLSGAPNGAPVCIDAERSGSRVVVFVRRPNNARPFIEPPPLWAAEDERELVIGLALDVTRRVNPKRSTGDEEGTH